MHSHISRTASQKTKLFQKHCSPSEWNKGCFCHLAALLKKTFKNVILSFQNFTILCFGIDGVNFIPPNYIYILIKTPKDRNNSGIAQLMKSLKCGFPCTSRELKTPVATCPLLLYQNCAPFSHTLKNYLRQLPIQDWLPTQRPEKPFFGRSSKKEN